jgi:replicative DNA helicase
MTITDALLQEIDIGREGRAQGYSMGLPKVESIIDGVTKRTMTVLASGTGQGKSSYILYAYVYRPLMEHLDDENFYVSYFSLEMPATVIFGKLLSTYIFETYGKELSIKEILSRKKGYILSDEDYQIVQDSLEWLRKVEKKIHVYDKSLNADKLYAILMQKLEQFGEFEETENRKLYKPHNPDLLYEVVIDHVGLLRPSNGRNKKGEIDMTVAYLVTLRNMCDLTVTLIQQINREQSNIERFKAGRTGIQLSDLKETGDTTDAAEVVAALYGPNRDKLNTYRGYDVKKLGDHIRMLQILKTRFGEADKEIALNFHGNINIWSELPLPNDIYDYDKYVTPDYLLSNNEETTDDYEEIKEDNTEKQQFKLII